MATCVRLLLALSISAALPWSASAQPPQFTVELLAAPGGGGVAYDINDIGLIVGHALAVDNATHAVFWNGKKVTDLGTVSFPVSFAKGERPIGINRSGMGFFNSGSNGYLFNTRTPAGDLTTFYNAALAGINDEGFLVGTSGGVATVWGGTSVRQLGTASAGLALNNSTVVTGFVDVGTSVAIRWHFEGDLDSIELLTPPTVASAGFAIDDFANVAGTLDVGGVSHAAATAGADLTALSELPQTASSRAWDININQWIVGESTSTTGRTLATLWVEGTPYELSALVVGGSPFQHLRTAYGLNDRGEIVGAGEVDGVVRPFVLRPKKGNRAK